MPRSESAGPAVSILLLTRNGAGTLPAVLDAIASQAFAQPVEIVAVDTSSTDGTADLLARRAARVLSIGPAEFDHGATRNRGIAACRAPLVVLLVQDAVPASPRWLDALTEPFGRDPRLAGTWARQTPRLDADPITRFYLERWLGSDPEPRVREIAGAETFGSLSPRARYELCAFDNVCSCVRRDVWARIPFRPTAIAEDVEWARDVLLAGYRLAYLPDAAVVHSHDRSARYELARTVLVHHRLRALFGLATVPTAWACARGAAATLRRHAGILRRAPRQAGARRWLRALALSIVWPLGQYLGARLADWRVARVPGFMSRGV